MSYYQEKKSTRLTLGQDGNALFMLIAVQMIAFVLLAFIKVIYFFTSGPNAEGLFEENIMQWIALPASFSHFLTRPWTLITHFFAHAGVMHLIGNMIWLWVFGNIFQSLIGNKKIFPLFLFGALAGAVIYLLAYNTLPGLIGAKAGQYAVGASAGVMAIAIGTTVLAPGYRLLPMLNGGIPLWVITAIFVLIDLATIPQNNAGGHLAHLAGAGMGLLFVQQLRRGNDWSTGINHFFDWVQNLFNPSKPAKGKSPQTQLYYKSTVKPFKKTTHLTQQRVDELLEKIHQKGYNALTDDEKELLKRASREEL